MTYALEPGGPAACGLDGDHLTADPRGDGAYDSFPVSCTVTARQEGDAGFFPAGPVTRTLVVDRVLVTLDIVGEKVEEGLWRVTVRDTPPGIATDIFVSSGGSCGVEDDDGSGGGPTFMVSGSAGCDITFYPDGDLLLSAFEGLEKQWNMPTD